MYRQQGANTRKGKHWRDRELNDVRDGGDR
jgi:hypothetical protein